MLLHNMHRVTTPLLCLALLACQVQRTARDDSASGSGGGYGEELEGMLTGGATAWNRGDLDAFMSDYHPDSARTTFVGSRGLLHGRAAIREAYAPRFAEGAERDSLSFEGIAVDSLAPGVAHLFAYYVLSRGDSVVARGPTSLVVLRDDAGAWKIVHDHSS
jgi:uncharacterized protein (TIGR02246 family)